MTHVKEPTDMGMNRTGIAMSPIDSKEMAKAAEECTLPPPGDESEIAKLRASYIATSSPQGTMPPPASVKGVVRAVIEGLTTNPAVFQDKLGERLAFERSGARLYEALVAKYDALGSFDGGPSREMLSEFHDDELRHFHVLKSALESLGADPTAVTPSANLVGVESMGLIQAITDPRTTLAQSLHAMLVAELADTEGWEILIELATMLDHDAMADDFRDAIRAEERHLAYVRQWVVNFTMKDAEGTQKEAA
jgi:rubrerythrin